MGAKKISVRTIAAILIGLLGLGACAEIQVKTIPPPAADAKLRVFLLPLSGEPPRQEGWGMPHEEWAGNQLRQVGNLLQQKGIYRVIPEAEVRSVVGPGVGNWDWQKNNWALAQRAGEALYADYILIMFRDTAWRNHYFDTALVNVETGKKFKIFLRVPQEPAYREARQQINKVALLELFRDARGDMMATAMRKGRAGQVAGAASAPKGPSAGPPKSVVAPVPPPKGSEPDRSAKSGREVDLVKTLQMLEGGAAKPGRARLAVYDFSAPESSRIAALILAEALREELAQLGGFTLVNRENIVQVLSEMGLQQSGMIDDSQAVRAGKGLAVQQIVTGQLGGLGKTVVLQAKRVDVETQGTVTLGSLKCAAGKEDELLEQLPQLARRLAGLP